MLRGHAIKYLINEQKNKSFEWSLEGKLGDQAAECQGLGKDVGNRTHAPVLPFSRLGSLAWLWQQVRTAIILGLLRLRKSSFLMKSVALDGTCTELWTELKDVPGRTPSWPTGFPGARDLSLNLSWLPQHHPSLPWHGRNTFRMLTPWEKTLYVQKL